MPNAYISGTGMFVPERIVSNNDLANEYGIDTNHEWIHKRTGIETRHFAEEGVGSAELALPASEMAIANAGIDKTDLDMIIFATLSPRHCFPGEGVYLQNALGLPEAGTFVPALDIRNQCTGFLYGLATATAMVKSGGAKHVLLVGGETHSAALDLSTQGRTVSSLFGDGAGAAIVSATEEDRGVRGWWLGADGRFADILCQKVWDIRQRPFFPLGDDGKGVVEPEMMWAHMEGKQVFKNAVERMIQALMQACWAEKIDMKDIDLFLFHQANLRINQYVCNMLNIPEEKTVSNIQRFGNTTAATIPLLMAEAEKDGKLKPGMKVACVAFGSGFTWGSAIIDW